MPPVRLPVPNLRSAVAFLLGLALCLGVAASASAHPHVFIDIDFALRFTDSGLTAIHVTWRFDDVYSDAMLPDYLKKGEHQLSPQAVQKIETTVFRPLASYRYFTDILIDGVLMDPVQATGFTARLEGRAMVFDFVVPLSRPVKAGALQMLGFDPEYFIEYAPVTAKPVVFGKPHKVECRRQRVRRDTEITGPIDVSGLSCTIG